MRAFLGRTFLGAAALAGAIGLGACGGPAVEVPAESVSATTEPAVAAPDLASLPAPWNEADLGNGKSQFYKCQSCHTIRRTAGDLIGPNLHGVFERRPGAKAGFRFSAPLKARTEERWTPEMIDQWLTNPGSYIPGTAMTFNGIGKPENRRDLIAFLLIESRK